MWRLTASNSLHTTRREKNTPHCGLSIPRRNNRTATALRAPQGKWRLRIRRERRDDLAFRSVAEPPHTTFENDRRGASSVPTRRPNRQATPRPPLQRQARAEFLPRGGFVFARLEESGTYVQVGGAQVTANPKARLPVRRTTLRTQPAKRPAPESPRGCLNLNLPFAPQKDNRGSTRRGRIAPLG